MVYYYCMVPYCKNTTVTAKEKTFIMLPTEEKRRLLWLEAARRDPTDISSKSSLFICEDHFDLEKDMDNYMEWKVMGVQKRMKKDIVPHKFACQPDRKPTVEGPSRGVVCKRTKPRMNRKVAQPNRKRIAEGPSRSVLKRTKRRTFPDVSGDTPSTSQKRLQSVVDRLIKEEETNSLELDEFNYEQEKLSEDTADDPCLYSQEFMEDIPEYVVINHLTPDKLIKVAPQEVKEKESPHTKIIKQERLEETETNKYIGTQTIQKRSSSDPGNSGCHKSQPIKEEPPEEIDNNELIQTFKEEQLTENIDIKEELTEDIEDTDYSFDESIKQEPRDNNEGTKYVSAGVQAEPESRTISIQCSLSPTSDSRCSSPLWLDSRSSSPTLLDSRSNSPVPQDFHSSSLVPRTTANVGVSPIKLESSSQEN